LIFVTCDFALQAEFLAQAREQRPVRRVHVDTTQLDLNHKFELSVVQPPNDHSPDETKYYQLKQLEHSPQDVKVIFLRWARVARFLKLTSDQNLQFSPLYSGAEQHFDTLSKTWPLSKPCEIPAW